MIVNRTSSRGHGRLGGLRGCLTHGVLALVSLEQLRPRSRAHRSAYKLVIRTGGVRLLHGHRRKMGINCLRRGSNFRCLRVSKHLCAAAGIQRMHGFRRQQPAGRGHGNWRPSRRRSIGQHGSRSARSCGMRGGRWQRFILGGEGRLATRSRRSIRQIPHPMEVAECSTFTT